MLYFRANYDMKAFSHKRQDWYNITENEVFTDRELSRIMKMGYKVKYTDFTAIITSQKNVRFVDGCRFVISENLVERYR